MSGIWSRTSMLPLQPRAASRISQSSFSTSSSSCKRLRLCANVNGGAASAVRLLAVWKRHRMALTRRIALSSFAVRLGRATSPVSWMCSVGGSMGPSATRVSCIAHRFVRGIKPGSATLATGPLCSWRFLTAITLESCERTELRASHCIVGRDFQVLVKLRAARAKTKAKVNY